MQEIQFLEFMGGSNILQAFPNYLIGLRFIRISTVVECRTLWGKPERVHAQNMEQSLFIRM